MYLSSILPTYIDNQSNPPIDPNTSQGEDDMREYIASLLAGATLSGTSLARTPEQEIDSSSRGTNKDLQAQW